MSVIYRGQELPSELNAFTGEELDKRVEYWKKWVDYDIEIKEHPEKYYLLSYVTPEGEEVERQINCALAYTNIMKDCNVRKVGSEWKWPNYIDKEDKEKILEIFAKLQSLKGKKGAYQRKWRSKISAKLHSDFFEIKSADIIALFGQWKTLDEVKDYISKRWLFKVNRDQLKAFYYKNDIEIQKIRTQFEDNYDHLEITKKRGRIEQYAMLYDTQRRKYFDEDFPTNRAEFMSKTLERVKNEIEGDKIILDINQKINVDLTINANTSLKAISEQIPLLSFIVASVAAKSSKDPIKIMTQLQTSIYSRYSGVTGVKGNEQQDLNLLPSKHVYDWVKLKESIIEDTDDIQDVEALDIGLENKEKDTDLKVKKRGILERLQQKKNDLNQFK